MKLKAVIHQFTEFSLRTRSMKYPYPLHGCFEANPIFVMRAIRYRATIDHLRGESVSNQFYPYP